jgi:uncharacterized protein YcbK (DUF882 family)
MLSPRSSRIKKSARWGRPEARLHPAHGDQYCGAVRRVERKRTLPCAHRGRRAWVAIAGAAIALWTASAQAERQHTVKSGQTLAAIAHRYHVGVDALLAANRLERGDVIRPGDRLRVPERGVIYVRRGQSLSIIARRHDVSVDRLARANRMDRKDPLRVGQRLVLPGHEAAEKRDRAARRWGRADHPGVATFLTFNPKRRVRIRLVDRRGRPRAAARRQLRHLMRDPASGRTRLPPRRLVHFLARVSDHFGGRPIVLVSGFRPPSGYTSRSSRHTKGHALDFRVLGVPNRAVRDYCRDFASAGVGFYPRSTFVHLDVRREDAYWVDWSRPGEPPRYRPPGVNAKRAGSGDGASSTDDEARADHDTHAAEHEQSAPSADKTTGSATRVAEDDTTAPAESGG